MADDDVVLKVTLNNNHRFVVVIAKDCLIRDLKSEICKVSRSLFPSTDLGEIISVQSCCNHELPSIYKVGRLLKEGDTVLAYSTCYTTGHDDLTTISENTGTQESSFLSTPRHLKSQHKSGIKNDSRNISDDLVQENHVDETEELAARCDDHQECSSKSHKKKAMDKTNSDCKDSSPKKEKTRNQAKSGEFTPNNNTEQDCLNQSEVKNITDNSEATCKGSGPRDQQSRNQTQDLEHTINDTDKPENMELDIDKIYRSSSSGKSKNKSKSNELLVTAQSDREQESVKKSKKTEDKDLIDNISEDIYSERLKTRSKGQDLEQTLNSKDQENSNMIQDYDNKDKGCVNDKRKKENIGKKRTVFQKKDFILYSQKENDDVSFKKKSCSKDKKQQEKSSHRNRKHLRTQSVDKCLVDEDQRNRPSESASTGSQPSSIVSEIVFKSQTFKAMIESSSCCHPRRRHAIEKSVTKVAAWLVNAEEIQDDDGASMKRTNVEARTNKPDKPTNDQCILDPLISHTQSNDCSCEVNNEDTSKIYPVIDVLSDRVVYFDSDPSDASSSGGILKETWLSSCKVVIPKLAVTQEMMDELSKRCKTSQTESGVTFSTGKRNFAKRSKGRPNAPVPAVSGCQDTNKQDCGSASHIDDIIASSESEELFPVKTKLKHLMSLLTEPLPGNLKKPLEHDGKEEEDGESCFSTEILDNEQEEHEAARSEKLQLPLDEGATVNKAEENEDNQLEAEDEENQGLNEQFLIDNARSQSEHEIPTLTDAGSKTEEMSSPKKRKKKKKKSAETVIVRHGSATKESVLSGSGLKNTSSLHETVFQKDIQTSSLKQTRDEGCHEDTTTEEFSSHSQNKERKKKEKRKRVKEKISEATPKQNDTNEKDDVISSTFDRPDGDARSQRQLENIPTKEALIQSISCSSNKDSCIQEKSTRLLNQESFRILPTGIKILNQRFYLLRCTDPEEARLEKLQLPPGEGVDRAEENEDHLTEAEDEENQDLNEQFLSNNTSSQSEHELICEKTNESRLDKTDSVERRFERDSNAISAKEVPTLIHGGSKTEEVCMSSPKKRKKKKKKSEETVIVRHGSAAKESVLSGSGLNSTSSLQTGCQKDTQTSSLKQTRDEGCPVDTTTEEFSNHSQTKEGRKKEKRKRVKEKISEATPKQNDTNEREDVINKTFDRPEGDARSQGQLENLHTEETSTKLLNKETTIEEKSASNPSKVMPMKKKWRKSPNKESAAHDKSALSPRKRKTSIQDTSANSSNEVASTSKLLSKDESFEEESTEHLKKADSKEGSVSKENSFHGTELQGIDATGLPTYKQGDATTPDKNDEEPEVSRNDSPGKKTKKMKKEEKKTEILTEETSQEKERRKKSKKQKDNNNAVVEEQSSKKISSSFHLVESTELLKDECENSDNKKENYVERKKKRHYKKIEYKKESIRSHDEELQLDNDISLEKLDKPVEQCSKVKREKELAGNQRAKKATKRKETTGNNVVNNLEKDNQESESKAEIPKKKRKKNRKVSEEDHGKPPEKGPNVPAASQHDVFTFSSESENNVGVTDVLSWISKKINKQTPKTTSTKKTNKSKLLDLAEDDEEFRTPNTPSYSSSTSTFTPRSSSMDSRSRIFHKTPVGFTNTVPRVSKKLNVVATSVASAKRRKRRLNDSPPELRELTQEEKEILSGGVNRLDKLLHDDSFWG